MKNGALKRWLIGAGVTAALLAVVACAVQNGALHLGRGPGPGDGIALSAKPVPLNPRDPAQTTAGDFVYAGGIDITSASTGSLHGLSDLVVTPGGELTSVSDKGGTLFRARIVLDGQGRLTGVTDGRLTWLKGQDGRILESKTESDAEGLMILPGGDLAVSFERHHRILRWPSRGGPPAELPIPAADMPENDGMEGLAAAPSQGPDAYWVGVESGDIYLCRLQKGCERKAGLPRPPDTFRLAALTEAPDGRLVILHENYQYNIGVRTRVLFVSAPASDKPVPGDSFSLLPPMTTDNFEGVAVVPGPNGALRVYLIVDDNFSLTERTLLMAFDRKRD